MSFVCAVPILGLLFSSCLPPQPLATGYVEGEYVLVAPIETARIAKISVERGDRVRSEQSVIWLEQKDAEIAVANANAALAQTKSTLANLRQGARPEKIAALEASLDAAIINSRKAERDMIRQEKLLQKGSVAQSTYDTAKTSYDVSEAQVKEIRANLAYTRLPARDYEIAAAEAAVDQARASLQSAEWKLSQRTLKTPQSGLVTDIIHEEGEMAGPQVPVLSILPDNGVKLRLYLPQNDLASIHLGTNLAIDCDNCSQDLRATVSYISDGPEFTPPVIYSIQNRQKLVYMIEAKPLEGSNLQPGQIVSVRLATNAAEIAK
ncbi:HlyD family efflux transporter periplasmic adaptor subunit [uncultured Cohaesibacter sp.]|uniref:HlyD family secretion protein n=1 Tax=uncultured Cohaesibacter sp. TaxID=1002546 RepID=UPI00292FCCC6|nr:HlyD family efflux transporter periplasmic adaptor subunit [uncultured Cohaesibacter sp.]